LQIQTASGRILSDLFIKIGKEIELKKYQLKVYLYVATRNIRSQLHEKQKRDATHSIDEFSAGIKSLYFDPEQLMVTGGNDELIQAARSHAGVQLVKEDGLKYRRNRDHG